MYEDDDMKPNARSYTITMNAWAKSRSFGKAKKTRDLLIQMEKAYKAGNNDVQPNVFVYTAVVSEINMLKFFFSSNGLHANILFLFQAQCLCIYCGRFA